MYFKVTRKASYQALLPSYLRKKTEEEFLKSQAFSIFLYERGMKMLLQLLPLLMIMDKCTGNIFFYSDFELSDWGRQFQPANPVELLATLSTSSLIECSQGE